MLSRHILPVLLCAFLTLPACAQEPEAFQQQVAAAYQKGDMQTALKILNERLQTSPRDVKALTLMVYVYAKMTDWPHAQQYGEALVKETPADAGAWLQLGFIYFSQSQFDKAMQCADKVIAVAPDSDDGYALKGGILIKTGVPAKAIPLLQTAVEKVRKNGDSKTRMARMINNLAIAYVESGDLKKSLATCLEGLAISTEEAGLYVTASKSCRLSKDYATALDYAQAGLKLHPEYSSLYGALSLSLMRLQRKEEAEKAYQEFKKRDPAVAPKLRAVLDDPSLDTADAH